METFAALSNCSGLGFRQPHGTAFQMVLLGCVVNVFPGGSTTVALAAILLWKRCKGCWILFARCCWIQFARWRWNLGGQRHSTLNGSLFLARVSSFLLSLGGAKTRGLRLAISSCFFCLRQAFACGQFFFLMGSKALAVDEGFATSFALEGFIWWICFWLVWNQSGS